MRDQIRYPRGDAVELDRCQARGCLGILAFEITCPVRLLRLGVNPGKRVDPTGPYGIALVGWTLAAQRN
jgi:hypothetical protein